MKILVIRFSSIGDIVLTTPVVRALHLQQGVEVHYLTKDVFAGILEHNPYVAKIHVLRHNLTELINDLKSENFDEVIDLHHNLRTKRIKASLQLPAHAFHKLNFEKWLMVRFKINKLPATHIVDRYMKTISHLGAKPDGEGLDFFIPQHQKVDIQKEFGFAPGQFATIVLGAAHPTKSMTIDQIKQLCQELAMPVVLLGGKGEEEKANLILAGVKHLPVVSAAGNLSILQSASVIEQSGPIITPDTGMMHIAAAFKKPVVVVWGNTIPQFGMYPYYGSHKINWSSFDQQLSCRPCSKLGFEKCPKGHFKCMLLHDIPSVAAAAKKLLIPVV